MEISHLRAAGFQWSPIFGGAVSGLLAGIPSGIILQLGTDILSVLGGIVGSQSLIAGWLFHLILSTIFGALFGWHVGLPIFRTLTKTLAGSILWGIIFGVVWYAYLVIGIIIPLIVDVLELTGGGVPFGDIPGPAGEALAAAGAFALAYIVYGAVLGGGYGILEDVRVEPEPRGPDAD